MTGVGLDGGNAAPTTAHGLQSLILRRVWSSLWRHLPMLAISASVTAIAIVLAMRGAGGSQVLTPALLALLVGPTLMGLQTVVQGALVEDDTDTRSYVQGLKSSALRSTGYSLVPALALVLTLAAAEVYARTGHGVMLISLGLGIVTSVLTVVGFTVLVPLAVARPDLRGLRLWATSWYLFGRWPIRFIAPVTLAGLAMWVAASVASTLVLLLPAPIALLAGAAYWCCAVELGTGDVAVPDGSSDR